MNRRTFLSTAVALPLLRAQQRQQQWRTFEVTTRVSVLEPEGATKLWVPAALLGTVPYQRTLANDVACEGGTARVVEARPDGLGIVVAEFPAGVKPVLTVTSRVQTRGWGVPLAKAEG